MFQHLWRILIMAVIAVAAFFVVSSLSLSSRLDEGELLEPKHCDAHQLISSPDYAPRNWKYRWILLDGSLATIYLLVFMATAWLWRPVRRFPSIYCPTFGCIAGEGLTVQTRDNVRFAMSQELAQDENDADAEDYEIDTLHRDRDRDEEGDIDGYSNIDSDARSLKTIGSTAPRVGEETVVFAMGDDSDDEEESEDEGKGYKDVERRMRADEDEGGSAARGKETSRRASDASGSDAEEEGQGMLRKAD